MAPAARGRSMEAQSGPQEYWPPAPPHPPHASPEGLREAQPNLMSRYTWAAHRAR